MKIDIDIEHLYTKAKKAFQKCMKDKENKFLQAEIEVPLNKMILKNDYVKVKQINNYGDHLVIEAGITLLSQENKRIGQYSLVVDNNYQSIDDFLVFD